MSSYLLNEQKLSPQSINSFVSSVQFLYLTTLEMPWGKDCFPRVRPAHTLPVVLNPKEVAQFFELYPQLQIQRRSDALLRRRPAYLGSRCPQSKRHRFLTHADPHRRR